MVLPGKNFMNGGGKITVIMALPGKKLKNGLRKIKQTKALGGKKFSLPPMNLLP